MRPPVWFLMAVALSLDGSRAQVAIESSISIVKPAAFGIADPQHYVARGKTLRHISVVVDGQNRSFDLYVPPTINKTAENGTPLVVVFHGFMMDAPSMQAAMAIERHADAVGWPIAFGQGLPSAGQAQSCAYW